MKRYIETNALMEYCSNQKSKTISNNDIARFPTANVVEVTDKSMIPLVKDFVKDLEKLGGRATCDDIIKSMKR